MLGAVDSVPPDLKDHITLAYTRYASSLSREEREDLLELRVLLEFAEGGSALALAESESLLPLVESMHFTRQVLQDNWFRLRECSTLAGTSDVNLDELIETLRRLSEFADSPPTIVGCLYPMGIALRDRYERHRDVQDLDLSIAAFRQAFELDPDNPRLVLRLLLDFLARVSVSAELGDLDEIIKLATRAGDSADASNRDQYTSLLDKYSYVRATMSRDPDDHDAWLEMSRNLSWVVVPNGTILRRAIAHGNRYSHYGESFDLDISIEYYASLDRNPAGVDRGRVLDFLSISYRRRFELGHLTSDIDAAITHARRAIEFPSDESLRHTRTVVLADEYVCRARSSLANNATADYEEAKRLLLAEAHRSAELCPAWYLSYALCLQHRRDTDARLEHLRVAEECGRLFPEDHMYRPLILFFLASAREDGFILARPTTIDDACTGAKEVMAAFVAAADAASCLEKSLPLLEITCTQGFSDFYATCIRFLPRDKAKSLMEPEVVKHMHSRFLSRMSEAMWLGHTLSRRYKEAAKVQSTVGTTVATMSLLEDYNTALEWFEQGRAVVWSQIHNLRTPKNNLRETHPDLADELQRTSLKLEHAGRRAPLPSQGPSDVFALRDITLIEEQTVAGRRLAREHEKILDKIRLLDGFQTFLLPKGADTLLEVTKRRAVACINVVEHRCDALIIFDSNIYHVQLPELTPKLVAEWRATLAGYLRGERARAVDDPRDIEVFFDTLPGGDIRSVLREMWFCVVWPILEVYLDKLTQGDKSHITWCTTGELAFLPLHAAGPHDDVSPNAFDLVVSSYTPNLSSLQLPATVEEPLRSPSILVVARSNAPQLRPLRWTAEESTKVAAHFPTGSGQVLVDEDATVDAVLEHMAKHPYIHLACHGGQDADPMNSAFFLDGALTLKKLMEHKSSNAQLAFLSACETATGDKSVPNEVVHLAAGMLAVGYKSVVATMWSIGDSEAPSVADDFYHAFLPKRVPTDSEGAADSKRNLDPENEPWTHAEGNAAIALHWAVHRLRKRVGVHKFVKWMPYIHLGQ